MVERRQLVVVGIAGLRITTVHVLSEFQHVVGVARLRTVDVVDEVGTGLLAGEVLTTAVASESQRALARHHVPEEVGSMVIALVAREFADALEAHHLRHLCVGMHIVETVHTL